MRAIRFARAQAVIHHTHERWKTYYANARRSSAAAARTTRHRPGQMEALEHRQLMAATPLTFTADAGKALSLTISVSGVDVNIVGTHGSDAVNLTRALADTSEIAITGADGADLVTIDATAATLNLPIAFNGGGGGDSLVVNGTAGADVFTIGSGSVSLAPSTQVNFSLVESLTVSGGDGNDSFSVTSSAATAVHVDGQGDADSLAIDAENLDLILAQRSITLDGRQPITFSAATENIDEADIANAGNVVNIVDSATVLAGFDALIELGGNLENTGDLAKALPGITDNTVFGSPGSPGGTFVSGQIELGKTLGIAQSLRNLRQRVADFLGANAGATYEDLRAHLASSTFAGAGQAPAQAGDVQLDALNFSIGAVTPSFGIDATGTPTITLAISSFQATHQSRFDLDFGDDAEALGVSPDTDTMRDKVAVDSELGLDLAFTVNAGGATQSDFTAELDNVLGSIAVDESDLDFELNFGFLGAQVLGGQLVYAMDAAVTGLDPALTVAQLSDPATAAAAIAGATVTSPISSSFALTPTVGLNTSAGALSNAGFKLDLGGGLLGVTPRVVNGDSFDADAFDALIDFTGALPATVGDLFVSLRNFFTDFGESSLFSQNIPFALDAATLQTLGQLYNLGGAIDGDLLRNAAAGAAGVATVVPGGAGNEVQQVTLSASRGTFALRFGESTGPIAHDAEASDVQAALEALPSIGAGNVSVTRSGQVYTIEFTGALGNQDVPLITADATNLEAALTVPLGGDINTRVVGYANVQQLGRVLTQVLRDLGNAGANVVPFYNEADHSLTMDLSWSHAIADIGKLAVDLGVDLSPLTDVATAALLEADGAINFDFTFGIDLADRAVITLSSPLPFTNDATLEAPAGALTSDLVFSLVINEDFDNEIEVTVTPAAEQAVGLQQAIQNAVDAAILSGAAKELGFDYVDNFVFGDGAALASTLTGTRAPLSFAPAGDVVFGLSVNGGAPSRITLREADTVGNATLADLIADVQTAVNRGVLDDVKFSGESDVDVFLSDDTIFFDGQGNASTHRFATGDAVTYTAGGGTVIEGLSEGGTFFVIRVDEKTIKLAASAEDAAAGTAVNLTALGAGAEHRLAKVTPTVTVGSAATGAGDVLTLSVTNAQPDDTIAVISVDGTFSPGDVKVTVTGELIEFASTTSQRIDSIIVLQDAVRGTSVPIDGVLSSAAHFTLEVNGQAIDVTVNPDAGNATQLASLLGSPLTGDALNLGQLDESVGFTLTLTQSDREITGVTSDQLFIASHMFETGDRVTYQRTGGSDIPGLAHRGTYFVIKVDDATISLAASADDADAGVAITLGALPSGTHRLAVTHEMQVVVALRDATSLGFTDNQTGAGAITSAPLTDAAATVAEETIFLLRVGSKQAYVMLTPEQTEDNAPIGETLTLEEKLDRLADDLNQSLALTGLGALVTAQREGATIQFVADEPTDQVTLRSAGNISGNASLADLVADVNQSLAALGVDAVIEAVVDGSAIRLRGKAGGGVTAIRIDTSVDEGSTTNGLGFADDRGDSRITRLVEDMQAAIDALLPSIGFAAGDVQAITIGDVTGDFARIGLRTKAGANINSLRFLAAINDAAVTELGFRDVDQQDTSGNIDNSNPEEAALALVELGARARTETFFLDNAGIDAAVTLANTTDGLGFGLGQSDAGGVLAAAEAPVAFALNADLVFLLTIGAAEPLRVVIDSQRTQGAGDVQGDPALNTIEHLVRDMQEGIDKALNDAGVGATITVSQVAGKLVITSGDGAALTMRTFSATGRYGYLGVDLDGTVTVTAATHVDFVNPAGSGGGTRVSSDTLFTKLEAGAIADAIDANTFVNTGSGAAAFTLAPVPRDFVAIPNGTTPRLDVTTNDWVANPPTTVTRIFSELGPIDDFAALSYADILAAFRDAAAYLTALSHPNLDANVPLVDASVKQLFNYAGKFDAFVDGLEARPASNIEQLQLRLREALGLPDGSSAFAIVHDAANKALKLSIPFVAQANSIVQLDVNFDALGRPFGPEIPNLAGAGDDGQIDVRAKASFNLVLGVDLGIPAGATVPFSLRDDETAGFTTRDELVALLQARVDAALEAAPGYSAGDVVVSLIGNQIVFSSGDAAITSVTGPTLGDVDGVITTPVGITVASQAPDNSVQTIQVQALLGSFSLKIDTLDTDGITPITLTTLPIEVGASAAKVQDAVNMLLAVTGATAAVTLSGDTYTVTLTGTDIPAMAAGDSDLIAGQTFELVLVGATGQSLQGLIYGGAPGAGGTTLDLDLLISGQSLTFTAQAGALELKVKEGSVLVNSDGDPANDDTGMTFAATLAGSGPRAIVDLTSLLADTDVTTTGQAQANLPVSLPDDETPLAPVKLALTDLADLQNHTLRAIANPLLTAPALDALLQQQFDNDSADAEVDSLLESPDVLIDGLDRMFDRTQRALLSEVFSQQIPFIGKGLEKATNFIAEMSEPLLTFMNSRLRSPDQLINPKAWVQQILFDVFGPGIDDVIAQGGQDTVQTLSVRRKDDNGNALIYEFTLTFANGQIEITPEQAGKAARGSDPAVNEIHRVRLVDVTGGTFTLQFDGRATDDLAFDADAATVQSALEEVVGIGNVLVTGDVGDYHVEFTGDLGGRRISEFFADDSALEFEEFTTGPIGLGIFTPGQADISGDIATALAAIGIDADVERSAIDENGESYDITFTGDLAGRSVKDLSITADPEAPSGFEEPVTIALTQPGGMGEAATPIEIGGKLFGALNILQKLDENDTEPVNTNDIQISIFGLQKLGIGEAGEGGDIGVEFRFILGEDDVFERLRDGGVPELDVSFDIGVPGIGLELDASIDVQLAWQWDVNFGISKNFGFYTHTRLPDVGSDEESSDSPEMSVTLSASLIGEAGNPATIRGNLGPLNIVATDFEESDVAGALGDVEKERELKTQIAATFSVDVRDPDRDVLPITFTPEGVLTTQTQQATIRVPVAQADGTIVEHDIRFTVNKNDTLTNNQSVGGKRDPYGRLAEDIKNAIDAVITTNIKGQPTGLLPGDIDVTFDPLKNTFELKAHEEEPPQGQDEPDDSFALLAIEGVKGRESAVATEPLVSVAVLAAGGVGQNAKQRITFSQRGLEVASGQRPFVMSLNIDGVNFASDLGRIVTAPVTEAAIRVALQGHDSIGVSDVVVKREDDFNFTVEFKSSLANRAIPAIQINRAEDNSSISAARGKNEKQILVFGADVEVTAGTPIVLSWEAPDGTAFASPAEVTTLSAAAIRAALLSHPSINPADINVRQLPARADGKTRFEVEFRGALGNQDVAAIAVGRDAAAQQAGPNRVPPISGEIATDLDGDRLTLRELISPKFKLKETLVASANITAFANLKLEVFFGNQGERNPILPRFFADFHFKKTFLNRTTDPAAGRLGAAPFPIPESFVLDKDQTFFLKIDGTDHQVIVRKSATLENQSLEDLLQDIRNAVNTTLSGTSFRNKIDVQYDPAIRQITFKKVEGAPIRTLAFRMKGDGAQIAFTNVGLDLGSFITDFAGPFLKKLDEILSPFDFLIGTNGLLVTPLPLISDLAGEPVTLLSLARLFGQDKTARFLEAVIQIRQLIGQISDAAADAERGNSGTDTPPPRGNGGRGAGVTRDGTIIIFIGDFELNDVESKGTDKLDPNNPDDVKPGANNASSSGSGAGSGVQKTRSGAAKTFASNASRSGGAIDFPILRDPQAVLKLLLGQFDDVVLVTADLPVFSFGFRYRQVFPIVGPLAATLSGKIEASIDLGLGYDASGIRRFKDSGNPLDLLAGLFISDRANADGTGDDTPEFTFFGEIAAGAALNIGVASAGVEGGIDINVFFDLNDPNNDGRVRLDELLGNILINSFNPLAIFDISGKIDFFLRAYIEALGGLWSAEYEIARGTIFEFAGPEFNRFPITAAKSGDGTLLLNMGPNAGARLHGDVNDNSENFIIRQSGGDVLISYGLAQNQRFTGVTKIVGEGGEGNDVVDFSAVTTIPIEFDGGAGNDTITGGGAGDVLTGGEGNDTINGGGGDDQIFGGVGNDNLSGGGGADEVFGDEGNDTLNGNAGDDTLNGGEGNDAMSGGTGGDAYLFDGGWGQDTVNESNEAGQVPAIPGDAGAVGGDSLDFSEVFNDLTIKLSSIIVTDELGNSVTHNVGGGVEIEEIFGSAGADFFDIRASGKQGVLLDGGKGSDRYVITRSETVGADDPLKGPIFVVDSGDVWNTDTMIVNGSSNDEVFGLTALEATFVTNGETKSITYSPEIVDENGQPQRVDSGLEIIRIDGKGGSDTINVQSTPAGIDVEVTGGLGDDAVNVGVHVIGQSATVLLRASDTTSNTTASQFVESLQTALDVALATLGYSSGSVLVSLGGANAVVFNKITGDFGTFAASQAITAPANGKLTSDLTFTVNLDSAVAVGTPRTLNQIDGNTDLSKPLSVLGDVQGDPAGTDALHVFDTTDKLPNAGELASETGKFYVVGLGMKVDLTYNRFESLSVQTGLGDDSFLITSIPNIPLIVAGGGGDDAITATANLPLLVGVPAPITIDGEGGSDHTIIELAGQGASDIRLHDTGAPDDGEDRATLNATQEIDTFVFRRNLIALLSGGSATDGDLFEAITYDETINDRVIVNTFAGEDQFFVDDTSAKITLNSGADKDRFQVGQMYAIDQAANNLETTQTTRGFLSPGVRQPMTINGGDGNDEFSVFSNKAVLQLNGQAGDDVFTIRAFVLANTGDGSGQQTTEVTGGDGSDIIRYNTNAPVNINGGDGFDTVIVIGTEKGDDFVITADGVFGAGLNVTLTNAERLTLDTAEGNDRVTVLGTSEDVETTVLGSEGADEINIGGNPPAVVSNDLGGASSQIVHAVDASVAGRDTSFDGAVIDEVTPVVADNDGAGSGLILITPTDGKTRVAEDAANLLIDTYSISLVRAPLNSEKVHVTVSAGEPTPEEILAGRAFVQISKDGGLTFHTAVTVTLDGGKLSETIIVRAIDDGAIEGDQQVEISHSVISGDPDFAAQSLPNVLVDVTDNDTAGVFITQTNGSTEVAEATPVVAGLDSDTISVVLTRQPSADVTLNLAASSQLQYRLGGALVTKLTFTPANWDIAQTLTVEAKDDGVIEGKHAATIDISASSADAGYQGLAIKPLDVDVYDNDKAGVRIIQSQGSTIVAEGGQADSYQVVLTKQPAAGKTVTVNVVPAATISSTTGNSEVRVDVAPQTLTFTSANWNVPQTVTVSAVDNDDVDGGSLKQFASSFLVTGVDGPLSVFGSTGPDPVDRTIADPTGLPTDNTRGVTVTPTEITTVVVENGAGDTYSIVLTEQPTADVVIDLIPRFGQVALSATQLVFTPANFNVPQVVNVSAIDDGIAESEAENSDVIDHTASSADPTYDGATIAVTEVTVRDPAFQALETDTLNVFNNDSLSDDAGTLTGGAITGLGLPGETLIGGETLPAGIQYADFNVLNVFLGQGSDDFTIQSSNPNTLTNLFGGFGDDTFIFADGQFIVGAIDGQRGSDTIDYTAFITAIEVDLPTGRATGVRGGFQGGLMHVENVLGGFGRDRITGDDFANLLVGNGESDVIVGNGGDDVIIGDFAQYLGGNAFALHDGSGLALPIVHGNDQLFGNLGDDTLIDGIGNDLLDGGKGDDLYRLTPGSGKTENTPTGVKPVPSGDVVIDASGLDELDFSLASAGLTALHMEFIAGQKQIINAAKDTLSITGTIENLTATRFDDIVFGNLANNRVLLLDGNDKAEGSLGDDTIDGGDGADTLLGQAGADTLLGQAGNDTIRGGDGNDVIEGGAGLDALFGDNNNDVVRGGDEADALSGGAGNDQLFGDAGADTLHGDAGDDALDGGADGDQLFGDLGNDTLAGGAGLDVFDGGAGIDTLDHSADPAPVIVDLSLSQTRDGFGNNESAKFLENIVGTVGDDMLTGTAGVNVFTSGGGSDTIVGKGAVDVLRVSTTEGDDVVTLSDIGGALQVVNTVDGATTTRVFNLTAISKIEINTLGGDDQLFINDLAGTLLKNVAVDLGEGDDLLDANPLGGTISTLPVAALGQGGDDHFIGGAKNDNFNGGAGRDTVEYSRAAKGVIVALGSSAAIDGNGGADLLSAMERLIGSTFNDTLTAGLGGSEVFGLAGNDTLRGGSGIDTLDGGAGNDTIVGAVGNDVLIGGEDNDTLVAGVGRHSLFGGSGNDTLRGGGDDLLDGGAGDDTFFGTTGDTADYSASPIGVVVNLAAAVDRFAFDGLGGRDVFKSVVGIAGSQFADEITGSALSDVIIGNEGDDHISTMAGSDLIRWANGDGDDVITGSLFFAAPPRFVPIGDNDPDGPSRPVIVPAVGHTLVITGGLAGDRFLTTDAFGDAQVLTSIDGVDSAITFTLLQNIIIDAGSGDDVIEVDMAANPGLARFTANLGEGDDTLDAIASPFVLAANGEAGDDAMIGGSANDIFDGGAGFDTVSYARSAAGVVGSIGAITTDGRGGKDTLLNIDRLIGSAFADRLTGDNRANVIDGAGGEDKIFGLGGDDELHGGDGNDEIDGGIGNDMLMGEVGNDKLNGSIGNDHFLGGAGDDTFNGGGGADTANYADDPDAVSVDLNLGLAADGFGDTDTLVNIPGVLGSFFNDIIVGDAKANTLDGNGGDDTVNAGAGIDTILWSPGQGLDRVNGEDGSDVVLINGTAGDDSIDVAALGGNVFVSSPISLTDGIEFTGAEDLRIEVGGGHDLVTIGAVQNAILKKITANLGDGNDFLNASAGNRTLEARGGAGDDNIEGGSAKDLLDGGLGRDTATFLNAPAPVDVNLGASKTNNDGFGNIDSVLGFENIVGSFFAHACDAATPWATASQAWAETMNFSAMAATMCWPAASGSTRSTAAQAPTRCWVARIAMN